MKKQTNKQIYDALLDCVNRAVQDIVKNYYPDGLPKAFFYVVPAGFVKTMTVTGAMIYTGHYAIDKPTKKDIESINGFRLCFPEYSINDIVLQYEEISDKYKSTSGLRYSDIGKYMTDFKDAEQKAAIIKAERDSETNLLATGNYIQCPRCRKVVLKSSAASDTIIGRGRKQVWNEWKKRYDNKAVVTQEKMIFCSNVCAGHEQMSREG